MVKRRMISDAVMDVARMMKRRLGRWWWWRWLTVSGGGAAERDGMIVKKNAGMVGWFRGVKDSL